MKNKFISQVYCIISDQMCCRYCVCGFSSWINHCHWKWFHSI